MRVGENSMLNTVRDTLNKSRLRLNDLQKQNATMKRVNTPSDDPVGTAKLMTIRNESLDNEQFEWNSNIAKTFLNYTDSSLEELTNLIVRAKELALGQASSAANGPESRLMVAEEIKNLQQEINGVANRKLGDRFIFSGYRTSTQPFDPKGNYAGDSGKIMVEVQKDVFVGMNLPGDELFHGSAKDTSMATSRGPASGGPELAIKQPNNSEAPAAAQGQDGEANPAAANTQAQKQMDDIFRTFDGLRVGLMTNDVDQIRNSLEPLDRIRDRVITLRAQVGARMSGIDTALANMGKKNLFNAELQSNIEDSDIIQVVSDMAREETVLRASLQASNKLIQPTLLDFLK